MDTTEHALAAYAARDLETLEIAAMVAEDDARKVIGKGYDRLSRSRYPWRHGLKGEVLPGANGRKVPTEWITDSVQVTQKPARAANIEKYRQQVERDGFTQFADRQIPVDNSVGD